MAETFKEMMTRIRAQEAARAASTGAPADTSELNLDAEAADPEGSVAATSAPVPAPAPTPAPGVETYKGNDIDKAKINHIANGIRAKFADKYDFSGMSDEQILQRHRARFASTMTPEDYDKKLQSTYLADFKPTMGQRVAPLGNAVKETAVGLAPYVVAEAPKIAGAVVPALAKTAATAAKALPGVSQVAFGAGHAINEAVDTALAHQVEQAGAKLPVPDAAALTQDYFSKLQPGLKAQGFTDEQIMDEAQRRAHNVVAGHAATLDSIDQTVDDLQRAAVQEPSKAVADALFLGFGAGPLNKAMSKIGLGAAEGAAAQATKNAVVQTVKHAATGAVIGGVSLGAQGATRAAMEAGAANMTPAEIAKEAVKGGVAEGRVGGIGGAALGGAAGVLEGTVRGVAGALGKRAAKREALAQQAMDEVDQARLEGWQERRRIIEENEAADEALVKARQDRVAEQRAQKISDTARAYDPQRSRWPTEGDPSEVAKNIIMQEHGEDGLRSVAGMQAASEIARKLRISQAANAEIVNFDARNLGEPGAPIEGTPEMTQPGALAGTGQVPESAPTALVRPQEPNMRMQGTVPEPVTTMAQPLPEKAALPPIEQGMNELPAEVKPAPPTTEQLAAGWQKELGFEPKKARAKAAPKPTETAAVSSPTPVSGKSSEAVASAAASSLPEATQAVDQVSKALGKIDVGEHALVTPAEGGIHIARLGLPNGARAEKGALGAALDHIVQTADEHGVPVTARLTKVDSNGGKIPIEKQLKAYWEPRGFTVTSSTKLPEGEMATADVRREATPKPVEKMPQVSPVMQAQTDAAIAKPDSPATKALAAPAVPPAPGRWHQQDLWADNNIAQARERIKAREAEFPEAERKKSRERGSVSNKPLEPGAKDHVSYDWADFADRVQIGVNLLLKHGLNKLAWAEQMVKELGGAIRPMLDKLYAESVSTLAGRRASGLDEVRLLTDKYTHEIGLGAGATRHDVFPVLNEKFAQRVATAYDMLDNAKEGTKAWKEAKQSYDAFNQEIAAQYKAMIDAGYKVEFTHDDPYATSADMRGDIAVNKRLKAFATPEGHHPFMTAEQNNMFRAVHDFFGHAAEGYEFGPRGEDAAFRKHASTLSEDALPALATETRGQNAWVNFMPKHAALPPQERPFAEQKFGLLPKWTYEDVLNERRNRAQPNRPGRGLKVGKASPEAFGNAAEELARGVRPASNPATIKSRFMADGLNTINERMKTHPESATWYADDIAKMHAMVADRIPEVHTPGGQALFDLLLAFTSPQKPVTDNFAIAYEMMHDYTRTGKVPMLRRFGQEVNTVSRKWVPRVNDLIKKYDGNLEAVRDYLLTKDEKGVYNVAKEFGPKVGPFTLNIQGVHDQVTIDVWMVRRLRRLAGQMFKGTGAERAFDKKETPTAAEQKMLTDGIREIAKATGLDADAVQAVLWDHEKDVWDAAGHRAPKIPFSKAAEGVLRNLGANNTAIAKKAGSAQQGLLNR